MIYLDNKTDSNDHVMLISHILFYINQSIKLLLRLYPQRTELRGEQILSVIMCHNRGQSRFVNRELGCCGTRVGKPSHIGEISIIPGLLRLFLHYVLAQAGLDQIKRWWFQIQQNPFVSAVYITIISSFWRLRTHSAVTRCQPDATQYPDKRHFLIRIRFCQSPTDRLWSWI